MRPFDVMVSIRSWPDVERFESSKGIRRLLLRPRRDGKEVDVGASSIEIVESILCISVVMPGVLLPRKVVRNIHKSRSATRHAVKPISACLAKIEPVSVNRVGSRIKARWPAV